METILIPFIPFDLLGYNNGGMIVKAAMTMGNYVNGYPEFAVAAEDSTRNAAVSWRAYFQYNTDSKKWEVNFYWGNYKHGDIEVEGEKRTPIQRAMADMAVRAVGLSLVSNLPTEV